MTKKEKEFARQLFNIIVSTLLSARPTSPLIIREHLERYARITGETYEIARERVTLEVSGVVFARLAQL